MIFDRDALTFEYHHAFMAGLSLLPVEKHQSNKLRVLVLGTGAAVFPMFMRSQFADRLEKMVTVDISENMLKVAQDHFGFTPDDGVIESVVADAYEYVESAGTEQFDLIFMDVSYEEGNTGVSPPLKYLQPNFITKVVSMLKPGGLAAYNTIIKDRENARLCNNYAKSVKGCMKFGTATKEDKNVVVHFIKGEFSKEQKNDLLDADIRTMRLGKLVTAWGLNKVIFLNRKTMKIYDHALEMVEL